MTARSPPSATDVTAASRRNAAEPYGSRSTAEKRRSAARCDAMSATASAHDGTTTWGDTPLCATLRVMVATASGSMSLAVTVDRPGTSRWYRRERRPDAASPSRTV